METIIGFMTAVFRRNENELVVFIAVISAFLFTSYNLNVSKKIGRLSSVCNYDDVVYLNKAAEIYFNAKENGIVSGAKLAVTHSLHAPFTVYNLQPWDLIPRMFIMLRSSFCFPIFSLCAGSPVI